MKNINRLTYLVLYIILISILYAIYTLPVPAKEPKYFIMTSTAYSNNSNCVADKWRDGFTAMGTPIREGIVAINVDWIDNKWQVRSPLKLGQKIYIEGLGYFLVEDTGRFAERDEQRDIWTVDIYMENYEDAINFGRQLKKVYLIGE